MDMSTAIMNPGKAIQSSRKPWVIKSMGLFPADLSGLLFVMLKWAKGVLRSFMLVRNVMCQDATGY